MLKSFSAKISWGQENFAAAPGLTEKVPGYPKIAERILKSVAEGRLYYRHRGAIIPITKDMFKTSQTAIRNHLHFLQSGIEKIQALKYPPPAAAEKEVARLKALIKAPYPTGKMPAKVAKPIAQKAAKEVIKRKGLKMSTKLLSKVTKSILPWVGWGVVIAELVRRGMKEVETEKKAEGFGEYYHRDIGWY